ncbi:MAG: hypothetical protein ABS81_27260 [Pseudonocardia sp. SCN 72-86]|nr:MAG: hypothetical protein ABS81_27260 [Pseudonocardia sp. SCN 72-86]
MAIHTVVISVNDTVSDLDPLGRRFAALGAPPELGDVWYTATFHQYVALVAADDPTSFGEVGLAVARRLLSRFCLEMDLDAAAALVLRCYLQLPAHPDVVPGVLAMRTAGLELVALSTEGPHVAEGLLQRTGISAYFDHVLSVEEMLRWQPVPETYRHLATAVDRPPHELLIASAQPWDLHGAALGGLSTAYIDRHGRRGFSYFREPDVVATDMIGLATALGC